MAKLDNSFSKDINKLTWQDLSHHNSTQYELIINLSGSSIGAKRWSLNVKKELIESRTLTNQQLIEWLIRQNAKPRFFCANAIGIYGTQELSTVSFDEDTRIPLASDDFLQQIGLVWEQSLHAASDADIPVTILRFGVVLKQGQGMLKKLELPFRLGLGSIIGSGKQILSWIHYADLLNAFSFIIEQPQITGPVNVTSPVPIAQEEFAIELARALKRPLFIKMPDWLVKALFGEMGECLLLKGQRVVPKRLTELGFKFTYAKIQAALAKEYQPSKG
jgi:uncharacterized protein (TIGR01777 family)